MAVKLHFKVYIAGLIRCHIRQASVQNSTFYWSFDRKTLFDDEAKAQKLISVKCAHFNLPAFHTFQVEMCALPQTW